MHLCLKRLCAETFCAQWFFSAKDFSLTLRPFWRAEQLRWVETNFEEMRKVDQCSDEMKTVEKNLLWWHVRRDGMRWEEMRRAEMRWEELTWFEVRRNVECEVRVWSAKCRVWSVHCEVWGKCSLGVALRRGRAQVMFLDNICATASYKARTHGPGWRTAHANSIDEKGLIDMPKATSAPPRAGTTGTQSYA